jgi:hypothetical protein
MAGAEGPDGWPKPLDVGNGQVCASFALDGSWLSLGCPHPIHGFVERNGAPAFDEALRGRPDAVRRYRRQLTLAGNAALRLTGDVPDLAPEPGPAGRPRWSGADRAGSYRAEAWAAAGRPSPSATSGGPGRTSGPAGWCWSPRPGSSGRRSPRSPR